MPRLLRSKPSAGEAPAAQAEPLPLEGVGGAVPTSMLTIEQLRSAIESLLFVAGRPLQMNELRRLLLVDDKRLRRAIVALAEECERGQRGVRVLRTEDSVQFVSSPENARFVAALLGLPTQAKLTTAALETLAVVAYRQPITRSQIEFIRGVNSDRALASLIQHGLVVEVGRANAIGRPALFGTTPEFLQQFGLGSLDALPKPETAELEALDQRLTATADRIRRAVGSDDEPVAPAEPPEATPE
jgi:segregation and condensation protein B